MKKEQWKDCSYSEKRVCADIAAFLSKAGIDTKVDYDYDKRIVTWTFPDFVGDVFVRQLKKQIVFTWELVLEEAVNKATEQLRKVLQHWEEVYKKSAIRGVVWKAITENEDL